MKNNLRKTLVLLSIVAFAASFSSCNRGYGCPNNFSMKGDVAKEIIKTVVKTLSNKE